MSAVDRSDRGAHDEIGGDAGLQEPLEHADLDGSEAASSGQHECGIEASRTSHG